MLKYLLWTFDLTSIFLPPVYWNSKEHACSMGSLLNSIQELPNSPEPADFRRNYRCWASLNLVLFLHSCLLCLCLLSITYFPEVFFHIKYFFHTPPCGMGSGSDYLCVNLLSCFTSPHQLVDLFTAIISSTGQLSVNTTGLSLVFQHLLCSEMTCLAVTSLSGQYCC